MKNRVDHGLNQLYFEQQLSSCHSSIKYYLGSTWLTVVLWIESPNSAVIFVAPPVPLGLLVASLINVLLVWVDGILLVGVPLCHILSIFDDGFYGVQSLGYF